ncbi:MAG: hypothetical protein ACRECT_04155 [Thermoplasmata archaeon]
MGFLAEIVAATRTSIARPEYLLAAATPAGSGARPSLRTAVESASARGALLAEFKRVSPGSSAPELPTRSPAEFVRATADAGLAGYSCVATEHRFRGSVADVRAVATGTGLPVLFKDFVVDPVQLDAARSAGASAVLLIARLESEGLLSTSLAELARAAHARQLEVLLEYHDRSELRPTADVPADMYGVNVRDLDSLRMEPEVALVTLRAARGRRPLLGLSGVGTPADAARFWSAGVDGILLGRAVARAPDPAAFLRTLARPSSGVRA